MVRSRHKDDFDITDEPLPWETSDSATLTDSPDDDGEIAEADYPAAADPSDAIDSDIDPGTTTDSDADDTSVSTWDDLDDPDWDDLDDLDWDDAEDPIRDRTDDPDWDHTDDADWGAPVLDGRRPRAWQRIAAAGVVAILIAVVGLRVTAQQHEPALSRAAKLAPTAAAPRQPTIAAAAEASSSLPRAKTRPRPVATPGEARRPTRSTDRDHVGSTKRRRPKSRQKAVKPTAVAAAPMRPSAQRTAIASAASRESATARTFGFER